MVNKVNKENEDTTTDITAGAIPPTGETAIVSPQKKKKAVGEEKEEEEKQEETEKQDEGKKDSPEKNTKFHKKYSCHTATTATTTPTLTTTQTYAATENQSVMTGSVEVEWRSFCITIHSSIQQVPELENYANKVRVL